ncbi:hypothetical protein LOD99_12413 [Oopsacas minuta]|uniref:Uncharacterized protein n=1 Tax=Oopsacas minuta TaxID=111878 RepID=A0AAV7JF30_9METZ|nr:hypothetical protein LOD99_12413 [Oopsacas minuta]
MTGVEAAAWYSFVDVVKGLLGNTKVANYHNLVKGMLKNFHSLGTRMSIKLHYLYSHLERFPENLGDLAKNRASDSTKISGLWRNGTKEDGMLTCWQITAGALCVIAPKNLTRGIRIREHSFMIDKYSDYVISQIICFLRTFNSSYKVIHTYYMVSVNTDSRMLKNIILQYHEK